jgi:sortase (surface protein transpeptidase)
MSGLVSSRDRGVAGRAVIAAALVVIATTATVSLWSADRVAVADTPRFEIQSASVVGAVSGDTLAPAVRLDPPQPVANVPVASAPVASAAPVVNRSTCRNDLPGAVMTITMPDIAYSCNVYAGGQKMLNSGAATQITDDAISRVLADHPGGPGVFWIAGHRTSHGGAFAAVPNLADGALITLSDGTITATYRVAGRAYVAIRNDRVVDAYGQATSAATLDSIIRADHGGNGAARLLLQTCDGEGHRWMIYADLVTP